MLYPWELPFRIDIPDTLCVTARARPSASRGRGQRQPVLVTTQEKGHEGQRPTPAQPGVDVAFLWPSRNSSWP